MGNINNYHFNKLDLLLSNSDYWDFILANDERPASPCNGLTSGDCFVVWYDFNNVSIYPDSATTSPSIYSLVTWNDAVNTGYTINTIGLTGIDNGLVIFEKLSGDTSNLALLSALTGTTLVVTSGETRLLLNMVTGTTGDFIYPVNRIIDPTFTIGDYVNFAGGFYQGYYKLDGYTYEVLPVRVHQAWSAEFWLNPNITTSGNTGTTLNDIYPDNKGIFFYMGTRAENKFWNQFGGVDSGCTSGCTQDSGCTGDTLSMWCTIPKEKDISIIGDYGVAIPLSPPQVEISIITNPFLIYGRAYNSSSGFLTGDTGSIIYPKIDNTSNQFIDTCCDITSRDGLGSYDVCSYDGNGIVIAKSVQVLTNFQNPFLIYGRGSGPYSGCTCSSCCGPQDGLGNETVCSFSGMTAPQTQLDYNLDIVDNALAFIIKDDGSIGYRLLTMSGTCYTANTGERLYTSGTTIKEEYSVSGMVSANTWSYVVIRFVTNYLDNCDLKTHKPRVGNLMFYVNARLKFVVHDFPEFVARRLQEYKGKQVGVPFNISLGGGSQGLLESQTFDGLDMEDRGLPIEKNFAGSFIGSMSQFKLNICDLSFCDIKYNYLKDIARYK